MSNVQQVAAKVRQELAQQVPNGVQRYVTLCENLRLCQYADGRFHLGVNKQVDGKNFYEGVAGGTARNIDTMVAAAFEARKRVYRKAEAYRQKLQSTTAPTQSAPAPTQATPTPKRSKDYILLEHTTWGEMKPCSPPKYNPTTLPDVYTRFAIIGLSSAAGFIIGWLIGGTL